MRTRFKCPKCDKRGGSFTHRVVIGVLILNFVCDNPDCARVTKTYSVRIKNRGEIIPDSGGLA